MIRVLEFVLFTAALLIVITEILYPLVAGKPLFGSFRKTDKTTLSEKEELASRVAKAKEKVDEVKEVQKEVEDNFKSAERLKEESDNLLNND